MELDRYMATQRANKMEADLKMTTNACEDAKSKVIELQAKLAKVSTSYYTLSSSNSVFVVKMILNGE